MNILVVGKKNHIHWPYYTYKGFIQNNYNAKLFYYNEYTFIERLKKDSNLSRFSKLIKKFKPNIIVFTSAFFIPKEYYIVAKEMNIYTVGWVGDLFGNEKSEYINLINKLYLFDSSLLDLSKKLNFDCELLQVGYDEVLHKDFNKTRRDSFNFIGSYTNEREFILNQLSNENIELYGLKWKNLSKIYDSWTISNKKIDYKELVNIYNSTRFSLNITQDVNVSNGVTMRVFETIACGSCLISNDSKDISLCFEPNKEILVFSNIEEFNEIIFRATRDNVWVNNIIQNAKKRLLGSEYSYKDRTKLIIKNLEV